MKQNYLIQKILSKLVDFTKHRPPRHSALSKAGKEAAQKHYGAHQIAKVISEPAVPLAPQKEAHLKYQRELEAAEHIRVEYTPEQPSGIPKLPKPKRII